MFVLGAILIGWLVLRVVLWESPFPAIAASRAGNGLAESASHLDGTLAQAHSRSASLAVTKPAQNEALLLPFGATGLVPGTEDALIEPPYTPAQILPLLNPPVDTMQGAPSASIEPVPVRRAGGHHLLLLAAFSNMDLPPEIAAFYARWATDDGRQTESAGLANADSRVVGRPLGSRWSGDAWLMLRDDRTPALATGMSSYGRSQAGSVVRYRLAPNSQLRPTAYVRTTRTMAGPRQSELAAGLALRPLAGVPVSLAAEVRVSQTANGRELRPAGFAVTELPSAKLPLGLVGEAYAQVGYVGGRNKTAFADGQVRVDRRLVRVGTNGELRAGVGSWGGAQKNAARLDLGPSATLKFRLGDAQARLAADYRFRVAGNSEPRSGPALTISAGF